MMLCTIWYHLYNLKNGKNTYRGPAEAYNCTKSNTSPWVFFTFLVLNCKARHLLSEQAIRIILKTASSDHTLMGGVRSGTNHRYWAAALSKWCWRSFRAIDPKIRWTYQATTEGDELLCFTWKFQVFLYKF